MKFVSVRRDTRVVNSHAEKRTRRLYPAGELRQYRQRHGVRLAEAAMRAGMSLSRASYLERDPSLARHGELDALRAAVDAIAAEMGLRGAA